MLSLIAAQEQQLTAAAAQLSAAAADLLVLGHVEAARTLSRYPGMTPIPDTVRLLSLLDADLDPFDDDALVEALLRLRPLTALPSQRALGKAVRASTLRYRRNDLVHVILDDKLLAGEPRETSPEREGAPSFSALSGALGTSVPSATLHLHAAAVDYAARRASAGHLEVMDALPQEGVEAWVDALASYPKADLRQTVRAYLAHRGKWDPAAAELGIHRNTLRYRLALASRLIDSDIDNPDVAAPLWLKLRDYRSTTSA